ncbi:ribosome biogenesis GTPase Der [Buchnera aphidicola (Ceratoglyphina bambusae)]|uniref:ribosome biogenesis GTPase Der n=1 Tax=Buchnera aphidicola TaxID=9 RepID=UPI0031B8442F
MINKYVSLIGRTNVGKSSLFNMFLNNRISIATDCKNFTRDSNIVCICNKHCDCFFLVDTAGIKYKNNSCLYKKIENKIMFYINNSKLILFVVSAIDGITFLDKEISKVLRKFNRKIFLIVNKSENFNFSSTNMDFYSLGFKSVYFTSSSNNIGIKNLFYDKIIPWIYKNKYTFKYNLYKKNFYLLEDYRINKNYNKIYTKIVVLGKPNIGKSTLINSIINENRIITDNFPGTTTDSVEIPFIYKNVNYIFIDTAGIRKKKNFFSKKESLSVSKTMSSIMNGDIIMLIIDASIGISNQDFYLINNVISLEKYIFIVINKWDLLSLKEKIKFKELLKNFIKKTILLDFHFISAKYKKNIFSIFNTIEKINNLVNKDYSPSKLTKILHTIVNNHKPPLFDRKKIKLKYANLISKKPFRILIHGNRTDNLINSYKKYLINSFIKHLNLKGITLNIFFKKSKNPYIK